MTVQSVAVIKDRIKTAEKGHKLAVFQLPPFLKNDGKTLTHNGFQYTKHKMRDWFDVCFEGMAVSNQLINQGHNRGGKLIGVYEAKDHDQFLVDLHIHQTSA